MIKSIVFSYGRDANNYQKEKKHTCFYKIIHFSVHFSAVVKTDLLWKYNLTLLLQMI